MITMYMYPADNHIQENMILIGPDTFYLSIQDPAASMEDVQRTSAMGVYAHWRFFWQQTLVSLHLCSPMDKCTGHWGKNYSSLWLKLSAICAAVPLLLASAWQDSLYSHLASISIGHLAAGDISLLRPYLIGKYHNWTYALYKPSHFENVATYSSGHKNFTYINH